MTCVTDVLTGTKYTLSSSLGEGATAKVWKGIDTGGTLVAVKIAHRGTSPALLEDFWSELALLGDLADTRAGAQVPWARKGKVQGDPDAAAIILEFIPDEHRLARYAAGIDEKPLERLALSGALQYANLMVSLHGLGFTMRGDRKAADLRWFPSEMDGRLVVLDWNRAKAMPADVADTEDDVVAQQEQMRRKQIRQELIRQDLRVFGQLWSELVLRRGVTLLPLVDDEADGDWRALSRGFRAILSRSLGSRSAWGFQSAEQLYERIVSHRGLLAEAAGDPDRAQQELQDVYAQAMRTQSGYERARLADQLLTDTDLFVRFAPAGSVDNAQLDILGTWAHEHISAADQQVDEAIGRVEQELGLLDYSLAMQVASETIKQLDESKADSGHGSLRLARWLQVARVGVKGADMQSELQVNIIDLVKTLQECVRSIESDAIGPARSSLEHIQSSVPGEIGEILQLLWLEINIRDRIAAAGMAESDRRLEHAKQLYQEAQASWECLGATARSYAAALRADLRLLDEWLSNKACDAELTGASEGKRHLFREAIDALIKSLQPVTEGEWPDLTTGLQAARMHYQDLRSLGPRALDRALYNFVSYLSDVNDYVTWGNVAMALRKAREWPELPGFPDYGPTVLAYCRVFAMSRLRQLANEQGWPEQLTACLEILRELQTPMHPRSPTADDDLLQIGDSLETWREALERYRAQLGLYDGHQFTNDCSRVLVDPENQEIDNVLEEANEQGIEIFDSMTLSKDRTSGYPVASLLAARRAERLVIKVQTLGRQMEGLAAELQVGTGSLENELDQARETRQAELTIALVSDAKGLGDGVRELSQLASQVEDQVERIAKAQASLDPQQTLHSTVRDGQLAVLSAQVVHGLQAVRELRLEGKDGATQWLNYSRLWVSTCQLGDDPQAGSMLDPLDQSVGWLNQVSQDSVLLASLRCWRQALLDTDIDEANLARRESLRILRVRSDRGSGWVLKELWDEHISLQSRAQVAAQGSPAEGDESGIADEVGQGERDSLFAQFEDLEDRADNLGRFGSILRQIRGRRDLSAEQQLAFSDRQRWYNQRKDLDDEIRALVNEWSVLLQPTALGSEDLGKLLEKTTDLVQKVPRDLPDSYLDALCEQLAHAYQTGVPKSRDYLRCFVWLGMLWLQIRSKGVGLTRDHSDLDAIYAQTAAAWAEERPKELHQHLWSLGTKIGLSPKTAAAAVAALVAVREKRDRLEKLQGQDFPECLAGFAQIVDELRHMDGLRKDDLEALEEYRSWYDRRAEFVRRSQLLGEQWSKILSRYRGEALIVEVEGILEHTNQLVVDNIGHLPAPYWGELAAALDAAYAGLVDHLTNSRPDLYVWLGLIYLKVRRARADVASRGKTQVSQVKGPQYGQQR